MSMSIQRYVDLGLFAKTVEKDSSIDLSPIDSGFSRYLSVQIVDNTAHILLCRFPC